ncbi:MAG: aminotransferase class V-fold PLP-dependent enzyme [Candidatus Thioglobus sp.]|jgi:cysteine desulfurase family protein (TIGR01976 family)|nr:aminotransferase class V-fold PLP-dependent enzyme [Candidatus Pseudothioglobus aerophilus]MBT3440062.1 aminotransferase class V-fold PLP-dependent enzyme [Gammaproteobacteria bacterium]MBT4586548.1 aminotransferase class V-fold PLP-dependent enzyme [Gammaproteobacteria bacterium]MBT4974502.1 aminotransferase class V-fold PLP-dependent enzyme [Gammaproteobacteria bacterium]MBT5407413.1 aminotransferase class V-fold PLP-dependent enzyme [Gammaproteobacteria bacterium]
MLSNNISLDVDYVKAQFPAFSDPKSSKWSFFENAGGSYVPTNVIEHLNHFMTSTKVQPYAEFDTSAIAGDNMDQATKLFAEMINAKTDEIIIGGSTTMNMYVLSNAMSSLLKPGDEVIVTNQDHEANVGAWRRLAKHGMIIKEWQINPETAELNINDLKVLLSEKTRIVAVTHCSNIVGSINDLKSIAKLVHEYDAYIVGDGVSYAPHGFPDVKDLDVDFYAFSLYKTFGPHLGLLYGKKEILRKLPNQNHEFLEGDVPYTLNPGGPNHEELSCLIGVYEYFNNLYLHHFPGQDASTRGKIEAVNELIAKHEMEIANPLLDYINTRDDINLIGKNKISNKDRAPTIAFTMNNKSSNELSSDLVQQGIATRNDNFYAWRCLKALGIDTDDGVVRTSMVHYNTHEDVKKLIEALKDIRG